MPQDFVFSYVNGHPGRAAVWYREQFVLVGETRGIVLTPTLVKKIINAVLKRIEPAKIYWLSWEYENLLLRGLKIDRVFGNVALFFEYLYDPEVDQEQLRRLREELPSLFETARGWSWGPIELHHRTASFVSDRFDPHKAEYYHPVRVWLGWEKEPEGEEA